MELLLLIFIFGLLSWLIYKDQFNSGIEKRTLLTLWAIKLGFAFGFILFNIYYFGKGELYGDVANFFYDGAHLADFAKRYPLEYLQLLFGINSDDPVLFQTQLSETNIWSFGDNGDFINDNRLLIRISSVIHIISMGSIWAQVIFFAFLSYTGTIFLYKTFKDFVISKRIFLFGLFLFPSIGFWGSSPSKEGLLILGFGLFTYALFKLGSREIKWKWIVLGIVSVFILLLNKPYAGLIILPLSFIPLIRDRFNWKVGLISTLIIVIGMTVLCFTPSRINLVERISYKQRDLMNMGQGGIFFINDSAFCAFDYAEQENFDYSKEERLITVKNSTKGEYKLFGEKVFYPFEIQPSEKAYEVYHIIPPSNSYIEVNAIDNSIPQLISNIPAALVNTMIRPFPNDPGDQLKIFSFVENIFFLTWIVIAFFKRKKLNEEEAAWLYYLITSAIIITLIIGLTIPILGAIVRYKMIVSLLLFIGSFIMFNGKLRKT
jgi:hypothetical protein